MKFQDIKPFIEDGNYEIDVFLTSLESTLDNYKNEIGLDLNPDFQRGHVWNEEQQIAYVEFFLRGGKSARVIYFNSPAYASNNEKGDLDDTLLCVDGLQRLTSLLRFIQNEIKAFGFYYNEFEDRQKYSLRHSIRFNINSLKNKRDVLEWYIQFNSGGTVHTKEEIYRVKAMLEDLKNLENAN